MVVSILITGGAGYIGSHAVKILADKGEQIVCVDNLSKGHRAAVAEGKFYEGDIRDKSLLDKIMRKMILGVSYISPLILS